jgi:hypothetical protein
MSLGVGGTGGNKELDEIGRSILEKENFAILPGLPNTADSNALRSYKYKDNPAIGYGFAAARRRSREADADPLNPYATPEMRAANRERADKELMSGEQQALRDDRFKGQELELGNLRFLADRYGPQVVNYGRDQRPGFWTTFLSSLVSDERAKTNIRPVKRVLPRIGGFSAFEYNWKDDGKPDVGAVAQNVQKSFPEAVSEGDETRPWMVNPSALGTIAIQGVGEMKKEHDALKQQVAKLAKKKS